MKSSILVPFFFLLQLCFVAFPALSQSRLAWNTTGGGHLSQLAYNERGDKVISTSDGGSIICGTTDAANGDVISNHGGTDIWVVKLNGTGNIQWQKSLGGTGIDVAASIAIAQDGGYGIVGTTSSTDGNVIGNHGYNDIWVVKLSTSGSILWQKCLGGRGGEEATSIKATTDGGYIVCGKAYLNDGDVNGNHGSLDAWVVKLSSTGTIQWQRCLGGSQSDHAKSIEIASDGGYVLVGEANSYDGDVIRNNANGTWFVKISANGDIQWQKFLGNSARNIAATPDGGYLLTGYTTTTHDIWVVKLSDTAGVQWQKSLGGTNMDYGAEGIPTSDGGYIVTGYNSSNDGDVIGNRGSTDFWVVKLTAAGVIQWQKSLGGARVDYGNSVAVSSDGSYVLTGYTSSNDGDVSGLHGELDMWVVKLTSDGSLQWQKCLGGTGVPAYNQNRGLCMTPDGGAAAVGFTNTIEFNEYGGREQDALVTKYASDGRIEWQKKLGGANYDAAHSVIVAGGGYVFTGYSSFYSDTAMDVPGNHGGEDVWVVKLSTTGARLWQKCLGGSANEVGNSIVATYDGGFILTGYTSSNDKEVSGNHGLKDVWVVKLSSTGAIQWQKCLGGTGNDVGSSISLSPDGGYILTGYTTSNNGDVSGNYGGQDVWVVKLSADGTIQWQKCLGGTSSDAGNLITSTMNGGYILTGQTSSNNGLVSGNHGNEDAWIVKLSRSGDIQWQKCYGGTNSDVGTCITSSWNEGYLFAGYTISDDGDVDANYGHFDGWVVNISDSGVIKWQTRLGGTDQDRFNSIVKSSDSTYILSGYTYSKNYDQARDTIGAAGKTWAIKLANSTLQKPFITSNDSSICLGSSILLEANNLSGVTYQWYKNGVLINGAISSSYSTDLPGTYTVRVFSTSSTESATSEGKTITGIDPSVRPSITASGPLSFCAGDSIVLTSSANSGNQWYVGNSPLSGAIGNTITINASGVYSVRVSNACGTVASDTLRIIRNAAPANVNTPYIYAVGDSSICPGRSVLLGAESWHGVQYKWFKDGVTIGGATDSTYRATVGGLYSVRIISTCSGDSATSRSILVRSLSNPDTPIVTASGSLNICNGGSVTLTSTPTDNYQWYKDDVLIAGANSQSYTATDSGTYRIWTFNACTNNASEPVIVTVSDAPNTPPIPNINNNRDTSFCQGGNVRLKTDKISGVSYRWFRNNVPVGTGGLSDTMYLATTGGTYFVRAYSTCSGDSASSSIVTVTVRPLPVQPIISGGPLSVCNGDSVVLTSSSSNNNQWYLGGTVISNATARTYTTRVGGVYMVAVSNGCGTVVSDSVFVRINASPAKVNTPYIWNVGDTTTLCPGGSVLLKATWTPGVRYRWLKDGVVMSGSIDTTYRATAGGVYAVKIVSTCTGDTATSPVIIIRSLAYPDSPHITASGPLSFCSGGSVTLTSSAAANFQWYKDNVAIAGATAQSYRVTVPGSYRVSTANSCGFMYSKEVMSVSVIAAPAVPTISVSGNTLSSSAQAGNQWYKDGVVISGAVSQQYKATAPGAYSVGVTQNGCSVLSSVFNFVPRDTTVLHCPSNVVTLSTARQCAVVVNSVEPNLVPSNSTAVVGYTLWGATTGAGTGSVSGKTFNKGITWVNYRLAEDTSRTCRFSVTVEDKEGPSIEVISVSPDKLWPPDHKMVDVVVDYRSTDHCSSATNCKLTVSSNEPQNGLGDGDMDDDWEVVDNHHIRLRAERSGTGDGRIYTIKMECTDGEGNSSTKTAVVTVPKGQMETKASPNPSPTEFTLVAKSVDNQLMVVRVLDMNGGLIETRHNVVPNSTITLGKDFLPGLYYIEFIQGSTKRTVKVLKVGR